MDLFAACDLNNYETLSTNILYNEDRHSLESQWSSIPIETSNALSEIQNKQDFSYEINNAEDKTSQVKEHNITLHTLNNNRYQSTEFCMSDKQLQHSLDLFLPIIDKNMDAFEIEDEIFANNFITHEVSDWELRFLDNYIEIPELIDFLPEKTPLCTNECEFFLQESSKNLKLHQKRKVSTCNQNGKTTYICNFENCCKVYAKPAHLKAHLRRHLGEKPYICSWPECAWKFSRSDELARHRRSHSGVKPYKCGYCTKCFARSDHLTKHRKVHERRLLAATKAGKVLDVAALPYNILTVRPGRKRKNQMC